MPLTANALAVEGTVLLIGSAILAAFGITIVANNDEVVSDWLNSCSDDVKQWIYDAGDTWTSGYNKILEISSEMYDKLKIDVHKHFKSFISSSAYMFLSVSENASGVYGFTNDESKQLKFHVPAISQAGGFASLFSDNYTITYYLNCDPLSVFDFFDTSYYKYVTGFTMYFKSNDLKLNLLSAHVNEYSSSGAFDVVCTRYNFRYLYSITNFCLSHVSGTVNGHNFTLQETSDGVAIIDLVTNNLVSLNCKGQSKTFFKDQNALYEFLFESVGLFHDNTAQLFSSVAADKDVLFNDDVLTNDVVIDKDYFPTDSDIETITKEAVKIVVPADVADVSTEKVLDTSAEDIYTGDLPMVTAPSNLFTDKFPFCLPWDLYNLVACFWNGDINDEAPHFEIPFVIRSVGINETIVIDFREEPLSNFSVLVDLLRFFVGFFYVLGLIMVTRKLIGGE